MDFLNKLHKKISDKNREYTTTLYKPLPGFTTLSLDPYVAYIDNALGVSECEEIIDRCDRDLPQAQIFNQYTGEVLPETQLRTCKLGNITPQAYPDYHTLKSRLSELVLRDQNTQEVLNLLKYDPGDLVVPHYDSYNFINVDFYGEQKQERLQRVMTTIVYLNDVDSGGETNFPELDITIQARRGRMVIWHNCGTDARLIHPDSKHQGYAPDNQTKYVLSVFWNINDFLFKNNQKFVDDCELVKQVINFETID